MQERRHAVETPAPYICVVFCRDEFLRMQAKRGGAGRLEDARAGLMDEDAHADHDDDGRSMDSPSGDNDPVRPAPTALVSRRSVTAP